MNNNPQIFQPQPIMEPEVPQKPKSKKKILIIASSLVLVVLIAVGVIFFMGKDKPKRVDNKPEAKVSRVSADGLVNGQSMECVPRGHDNYRTNSALAIDPKNADIIYVGVEYKGIYKSTDGGVTWVQSDKGVRGYPMQSDKNKKCVQELGRIIIDPKDNKHILASRVESPGDLSTPFSENAGLWESKDSGANWNQLIKSDMNASGSKAIAFHPLSSETIYYGVNNSTPSFTDSNGKKQDKYYNTKGILYKTSNGGQDWSELPTGADKNFRAVSVGVDPNKESNLWLFAFTAGEQGGMAPDSAQKGVLVTTDGGNSWKPTEGQLPAGYRAIADGKVSPKDSNNAFVQTQSEQGMQKSFVTLDGGKSWQESNIPVESVEYNPNDASGHHLIGVAPYASRPGVYESKDGGKTWTYLSAQPKEVDGKEDGVRVSAFAWSMSTPTTVYMSGSGGYVWKSIDNGKTWTTVMTLDKIGGANKNGQGQTKSSEQDQ